MEIRIIVEQGDALNFKADVLALKYAQSLHGLDRAVVKHFSENGIDLSDFLPDISESQLIDSRNKIPAKALLVR